MSSGIVWWLLLSHSPYHLTLHPYIIGSYTIPWSATINEILGKVNWSSGSWVILWIPPFGGKNDEIHSNISLYLLDALGVSIPWNICIHALIPSLDQTKQIIHSQVVVSPPILRENSQLRYISVSVLLLQLTWHFICSQSPTLLSYAQTILCKFLNLELFPALSSELPNHSSSLSSVISYYPTMLATSILYPTFHFSNPYHHKSPGASIPVLCPS